MRIVAPVMPRHFDEAQAIDISKYEDVNLIEWRADFLPKDEIVAVAPAIFEKFAGKEIIFTLRTVQEGGTLPFQVRSMLILSKKSMLFIIQTILTLSILRTSQYFKKCLIFQILFCLITTLKRLLKI